MTARITAQLDTVLAVNLFFEFLGFNGSAAGKVRARPGEAGFDEDLSIAEAYALLKCQQPYASFTK